MHITSGDGRELIVTDEGLTSAADLLLAQLQNAHHINLSFNALTSLRGLEVATQLRNLNLSGNAITSLLGIGAFPQLRRLRCSGNQIQDLSWLSATTQLEELDTAIAAQARVAPESVYTSSFVVKTVPALWCVDGVAVDDALREQSQRIDERALLCSAASDGSEISLMTSRSGDRGTTPPLEVQQLHHDNQATASGASTSAGTGVTTIAKKKTKKMTAEDFMRNFPVQDFIETNEQIGSQEEGNQNIISAFVPTTEPENGNMAGLSPQADRQADSNQETHSTSSSELATENAAKNGIYESTSSSNASKESSIARPSGISAISRAVMDLPLFDSSDGSSILQKKPQKALMPSVVKSAKTKKAPTTGSSSTTASPPDPALASFQQQESTLAYPSSTVNAIQIRRDGSALAKWPNGSVAVSIDRERDGFRCYAAHKDGTIALSFDADGVGFINYYPSGRMMVSTSSSGDGLYFSSDGSTILRQWDAQLAMKDHKSQPTETLSDTEGDGSLVAKLSDGLGIRLQLSGCSKSRSSAVQLQIFFASTNGIRHAFCNWINSSGAEPLQHDDGCCDFVFGKEKEPVKAKNKKRPAHTHQDTLHGIRAAVAKLLD